MTVCWLLMQFMNIEKHSAKIEALENEDALNSAYINT